MSDDQGAPRLTFLKIVGHVRRDRRISGSLIAPSWCTSSPYTVVVVYNVPWVHPDRQTNRKWCIRAHRAIGTVGSKITLTIEIYMLKQHKNSPFSENYPSLHFTGGGRFTTWLHWRAISVLLQCCRVLACDNRKSRWAQINIGFILADFKVLNVWSAGF